MTTKATRKPAANETRRSVRHSPMEHPRHQYPQETAALQELAGSCGLVEKIKWGKPCFTLGDKNIVLIQRFNDYIALLFFKGALLKDPDKLLFRVGEHMQAPRQLRLNSLADITRLSISIRALIEQAIDLEKSGAKVELKKASELKVPEELQTRLDMEPALNKAFAALTPGRQRGYIYQIAAAKQSATRASRVDKAIPRIFAGKGLND
ncbi:MAG TPA: YdeI/OmpD-associated family protein [Edaphobacter sp.]|uniref:YdeI/OmpD-associated family protein n=1 Tax=Edaphobacter sp. TaxID=1934404 RepID=UPI002C0511E0|nr:YdeI/OmpD-associated family protein [Edaphobacter sp.]HUZ95943.1 YdeI/OmpD-associated family protein [Edaphobacter sp.]